MITDHKSYKRGPSRRTPASAGLSACSLRSLVGTLRLAPSQLLGFIFSTGFFWRVALPGLRICAGLRSSVIAKITHLGDVCGYAF